MKVRNQRQQHLEDEIFTGSENRPIALFRTSRAMLPHRLQSAEDQEKSLPQSTPSHQGVAR